MGFPSPAGGRLRLSHKLGMLALALALAVTGCNPRWMRVEPATLQIQPRTRIQVWVERTAYDLHGITVGPDSLAGVPFFRPLDCSGCAVRIARADVDSLRVVHPKDDSPLYLGLGLMAVLFVMFSLCHGGCVPGR